MAMWSEELRRLTLFDGEAKLTPESRPVWQQNMELRTKFVRYLGPRPDGLHPTHFWFLEHYSLLAYFLQMQAEGIPAKVFFSIVSTCRYITVAERTEHLELRGLTGRKLIVSPEVVREAFGIPRDAARDEEQGATWPNQVVVRFAEVEELGVRQYFPDSQDKNENLISRVQAPREPAVVPLQIINDYLLCKAGSGQNPSRRGPGEAVVMVSWAPALMKIIKHNRALLFESPLNCSEPWEIYADCFGSYEQVDVLRGVHSRRAVAKDALPRILRLKPEERIENASQQAPAQPQPRKRRAPTSSSAPARETKRRRAPSKLPGPLRSLRHLAQGHTSPKAGSPTNRASRDQRGRRGRDRQGGRASAYGRADCERPEPPRRLQTGVGRQAFNGSRQRAIEQIPLPPSGQKKKKNKTPAVQSGREEIRRPNPRVENNARHRRPLKRSARTSDHAIPTKRRVPGRPGRGKRPGPAMHCSGRNLRSLDGPVFGKDGSRGQALDHGESGRQDRCFNQRQAIGCDTG
ncbi:hypothetical protein R1flu_020107 [Riccia fluitans]|uniref:Uncharacterized protein n=1 Tax=Riccia fluitans TaxID=41844 RepID=A0ABD1ZPF4_9MARC